MILPSFLDSHQKEGIEWILSRRFSYLAHAPGAGKTCEAIIAAMQLEEKGKLTQRERIIFIVPPNLTANWWREISKWCEKTGQWQFPLMSIVPRSEKSYKMNWNAKFIIVPDSMITKPWVLDRLLVMKKMFVAVDEASRFKEENSQRTIALFGGILKDGIKRPGIISDTKHGVLLDGSPMPNRPMELWAPTYALSPESIDYMERQNFGLRYCGAIMNKRGQWEFKHSSNEEELRARLTKSFMHVVTEDALNHPERLRSITFINKDVRSAKQRSWEKKNLSKFSFEDIGEDFSRGDIATYRRELGMRKVKWVAEYVKEKLDNNANEKILLFGWHRDVILGLYDMLEKHTVEPVMGDTSFLVRESIFKAFQKGESRLIIGNIAAMGRGHNLQMATRIIFAEYSWSDETNKQAEKRASRKGSKLKQVRCEYICAPNTMDEMVLNSVFDKAKRIKKVIG
jgi:SWI/SNF-related matrix-associated actin-dependent regulator 1 of chromatin subfamily A